MNIAPLNQELKQRLPSPTGVALAIMDACRRDDASLQEVVALVQTDPALTGRLLAQANSAANGARAVASVNDAVGRLGLQAVRQLALTFSLIDQYTNGQCTGFDYPAFWSHSLVMGLALSDMAAQQRLGSSEELFTCGLLARVGCLALATAYPTQYGLVLANGLRSGGLLAQERVTLHIDHLNLSLALLSHWGLPEALVEPVLFHEEVSSAPFSYGTRAWQLTHAFNLALQIADFVVSAPTEQPAMLPPLTDAASKLGMTADDLGHCIDRVVIQWKAWGERLRVRTSALPSFESIARKVVRPDQEDSAHWLRVLIVEDDPIILGLLRAWLEQREHHTVMTATNGREAMEAALIFKPHVVLTDWRMPVMDGIALCRALRLSDWGQKIYVLMLTSADQEEDLVTAFDAGVDDYLAKPVNMRALSARLKAAWRYVRLREAWESDNARISRMAADLAQSNRRLQLAALTDPLTLLANRRAGLTALSQAWSASTRHAIPLTLISIDIDHFKVVNDRHGHAAGDMVLQHIARCLNETSRHEDTVCRWGGEEFLVISPNMQLTDAICVADRLRTAIGAARITLGTKAIGVTASFGLAAWENTLKTQDQLLSQSDEALYAAKAAGRNRLAVFRQGKVAVL